MEGMTMLWLHMVAICAVCSAHDDPGNTDGQRQRMHEVVGTMLGFRDSPSMPHPTHMAEEAPKYMLDLYERFKDGEISNGPRSGNTVRSIQAKTETIDGQPMFVFDLSSLVSTDEMISAEIHMYKRRQARYNRNAELALVLHDIAPHHVTHHVGDSDKITLSAASYGWQWFDVTNNVQRCLIDGRDNIHSLGMNFESIKHHRDVNILKLKRFTHHHSVPYLVIYSNDSQSLDMDKLDKISENFKVKKHVLTEESDAKVNKGLLERTLRRRRSVNDNSADMPVFPSRSRSRSILTNEIPENPNDYHTYSNGRADIQTHPGMLQTRKETRHRLSDTRLIPYPGEFIDKRKRKRLRNRRRKHKGRKSNALELPKEWEDLQNMASEENVAGLCGKQKLIVDFNDIGWGEWIISPKSFKAHYCAGSCPFPLTKKLRPSNHATIQSLVNAVGIDVNVPAPCCVPDKLSSITLLYFDENRNVVLKNYPNMTVQKCACR